MKRRLLDKLLRWKDRSGRMPLILRGARQVGKTWLLQEFGRVAFEDVCYVNFEQSNELSAYFDGDLNPGRIIEGLSLYHGRKIEAGRTLLVFDEVQEVPRALTSLKYFCEQAPEYHICCAGSLLGVALHSQTSFPVGKVEFLTLAPLSFEEFLIANGKELIVSQMCEGRFDISGMESLMIELLKTYFVTGGMPRVVQTWMDTHDFNAVDEALDRQLTSYVEDFSKHAPSNLVAKLRYVWESIPTQLAKGNKRFVYGVVREGARAREYEDCLMWLNDMGLTLKMFAVTKPDIPLRAYADLKTFKLFLHDVGLLRRMSGLSPKAILEGNRIFEEFKGALTEQYVLQELTASSKMQSTFYWTSSGTAEVDFLLSDGLNVYPLEAKASVNTKAKSLRQYRELYHPVATLRTCLLPFKKEDDGFYNVPLYSLFALDALIEVNRNNR